MLWLPFYCTPTASSNVAILAPTLEDLVAATLNSKVLAKADNDEESKYDNDSCYEILIITPICSLATIPIGGNQVRGSAPSTAEGPHKTFTYKPKP
ncbi:hypothetical protein Tco_1033360 [Tanacetum coccineum]